MIRVGFHDQAQALVIEGHNVFPARSLRVTATEGGYLELWSLAERAERRALWSEYGSLNGQAFGSEGEAVAYLENEFAKPEQRGDAFIIPIAIAQAGQTRIPLNDPPTLLSTARLEVNGVIYRAPDIAASSIAIDWQNPDFPLAPSDTVTAVYS